MKLETLQDVFVEQLKDLHRAENQILKALPKLAKTASSPELKQAFEHHLEQTKTHVQRLDQVMEKLNVKGRGKICKGMEGLLEEGKQTLGMKSEGAVLDAAMIADAQRVEHYEIAAYGTVCAYAKQLGLRDAMDLLHLTLDEEEQTDKKLTDLAGVINFEASEAQPQSSECAT
jgi:ferritin-like metal-binding protein YciE